MHAAHSCRLPAGSESLLSNNLKRAFDGGKDFLLRSKAFGRGLQHPEVESWGMYRMVLWRLRALDLKDGDWDLFWGAFVRCRASEVGGFSSCLKYEHHRIGFKVSWRFGFEASLV